MDHIAHIRNNGNESDQIIFMVLNINLNNVLYQDAFIE